MSVLFKTGQFAKSNGTDNQSLSGFGFQPKAVLIWTSGGVADGVIRTQAGGDARMSIGFASGTGSSDQWAAGTSAVTGGGGGRRTEVGRVVLLVDDGGTVFADAVLLSFDADGFTIDWITNGGELQILHYFAWGGTDVQAKVSNFTTPAVASNLSVAGIGFRPSLILFAASAPAAGSGAGITSLTFGAATGPRARWATHMVSGQNVGSSGIRYHRNDRCAIQTDLDLDLVSMDADGFTVKQESATAIRLGVLCLELPGEVALGTILKSVETAPANNGAQGLATRVKALFLVSDQDIDRDNVFSSTGARFGMGAFVHDDTQTASVFSIPDQPNPIAFACYELATVAAAKLDNATPSVTAGGLAGAQQSGFNVTWNPNDAVPTEYLYIAFGDTPAPFEGHNIEIELDGPGSGWTNLTEDLLITPNVKVSYGIGGAGPTDLAAKVGACSFSLNNSEFNSGGVRGWYSPDSVQSRLGDNTVVIGDPNVVIPQSGGFRRGQRVRYRYRVPGTLQVYTKFLGRLLNPEPTSGIYLERRTDCDAVDWMADAADFELDLPMQVNRRADQALRSVIERVTQQPGMLDLDVADSTFPYVLDNSRGGRASAATEIQRLCQSEYGRFYPRGTLGAGTQMWRFEARSARLTPVAIMAFDGTMSRLEPESDIRNVASVSAHPRIVDATDTVVLFSKPATSTPSVPPSATIKITGRYSSSADRANKVGGTDMQTPVSGTDYVMNAAANGSGSNLTANFTVTADYRANEVEYTITNNGGTLGYIITLQARGRGVYDYTQVDAVRSDGGSIGRVGEKPVTLDMPYQGDFLVADAVAEFIVDTWATSGYAAARLQFKPRDIEEMDLAMSLEPGDAIAVSEEMTGVNGIYYIQSVELTALDEALAVFEWDLQRVLVQDYWTLGTAGKSELGITTVLAPL